MQRAQGETGIRTAITRLSDEQIGTAETLFASAQGMPRPLALYLDYVFANYREPQKRKLLSGAIALCTAAKDHEFKQDQISSPQLGRIKRDFNRLHKHFPKLTIAELAAQRLIGFSTQDNIAEI